MFNRLKNRQSSAQWNRARATNGTRLRHFSNNAYDKRPRCPLSTLSLSLSLSISLCSLAAHCLSFSLFSLFECLVCPFSRQLFQGINIGIDSDIDDCWPYLNGSLIDLVVVMTAFVLRRKSSGCLGSLYGQRQVGGEQ